jgi:lipid-A-disaccharide synthase-like uncharacterized protein
MAVPIILTVAAHTVSKVVTSPNTWRLIGTTVLLLVGTGFVLRTFLVEARETVASLWWVVVLIFLLLLAKIAVPIFIREREKTKREALRRRATNEGS